MANFDPPFAGNGERRPPASDEQQLGFGCGAADLFLFNWMFWAIQSELGEVISHAGLTPSNSDMTQVRQAIQVMIDASTGGGDTENYLTLVQASSRLQIFPEVQNSSGHFGITSPGTGQVRVPTGVAFLHRGISPYSTTQQDLATDASKTYHLRWNKADGFTLQDLASGTYNPSTLQETNAAFDSTYDDMLVARVITNSSNVPTITNLVNRARLESEQTASGVATLGATESASYSNTFTMNWARTPFAIVSGICSQTAGARVNGYANAISKTVTRYGVAATVTTDWDISPTAPNGELLLQALR